MIKGVIQSITCLGIVVHYGASLTDGFDFLSLTNYLVSC